MSALKVALDALRKIEGMDFRGSRPREQIVAEEALEKIRKMQVDPQEG